MASGNDLTGGRQQEVDDPEDPELDELLNDALTDFSRPAVAGANNTKTAVTAQQSATGGDGQSRRNAAAEDHPQMSALNDVYRSFEEALKCSLPSGEDAESKAAAAEFVSLMDGLTEEFGRAESENADDPLASTLADLSKTLTSDAPSDEDMAEIIRRLGGPDLAGFGEEGEANDSDDMSSLMKLTDAVVATVVSKQLLYPPLREICDRYPGWLSGNRARLSEEDFQRYSQQLELMRRVCDEYEQTGDDTKTEGSTEKAQQQRIMELVEKLQQLGQPPEELVGSCGGDAVQFDASGRPSVAGLSPSQCNIM